MYAGLSQEVVVAGNIDRRPFPGNGSGAADWSITMRDLRATTVVHEPRQPAIASVWRGVTARPSRPPLGRISSILPGRQRASRCQHRSFFRFTRAAH